MTKRSCLTFVCICIPLFFVKFSLNQKPFQENFSVLSNEIENALLRPSLIFEVSTSLGNIEAMFQSFLGECQIFNSRIASQMQQTNILEVFAQLTLSPSKISHGASNIKISVSEAVFCLDFRYFDILSHIFSLISTTIESNGVPCQREAAPNSEILVGFALCCLILFLEFTNNY